MRKIPCELRLGNGGDVVFLLKLDDDGTLHIPKTAIYGSFEEGVIGCNVMNPEDKKEVAREVWEE